MLESRGGYPAQPRCGRPGVRHQAQESVGDSSLGQETRVDGVSGKGVGGQGVVMGGAPWAPPRARGGALGKGRGFCHKGAVLSVRSGALVMSQSSKRGTGWR